MEFVVEDYGMGYQVLNAAIQNRKDVWSKFKERIVFSEWSDNLESKLWFPQFFQKRTKLTIMSKEEAQDSKFCSFFGRIEKTINCFRDLLTFSNFCLI